MPHLIGLAEELRAAGVHLRSLTEEIDTSTAGGEFYFHLLAALAQMERRLISERTKAAIAAARRRGLPWGKPKKFDDPQLARTAAALLREGSLTRAAIARQLGVSVATLYRHFPVAEPGGGAEP